MSYYKKGRPTFHIVILDIEMEGLDGMTLAHYMREVDPYLVIIFMTSHSELATDGYEVDAFRFLLKPVQKNKLLGAIEAAKKQIFKEQIIYVHKEEQEVLLRASEIYCVEAANKEVILHTKNNVYKERMNMGEIEQLLQGAGFFRSHRSYLVNLRYVKVYDQQMIKLDNGQEVYLSRSKAKLFKQTLLEDIRKNAW